MMSDFNMNNIFRETLKSVRDDKDSQITCDDLAILRSGIVIASAQHKLALLTDAEQESGVATYSKDYLDNAHRDSVEGCKTVYAAICSFNNIADTYGNPHLAQGLDTSRSPEDVKSLLEQAKDSQTRAYMSDEDRKFVMSLETVTKVAGESILPDDVSKQMEKQSLRERLGAQFAFGINVAVGDGERETRSLV